MIYEEIKIEAGQAGSAARLQVYMLDTPKDGSLKIRQRPVVLICPGGCYARVSFREGEPVAMQYLAAGFDACVLQYSVAPEAHFPTQVQEVGEAVRCLRAHAEEWSLDPEKIFIQGFSAGGHLAASYGVYWRQEFLANAVGLPAEELKPAGILLGYPVITTDVRYWHAETFENLLGDKFTQCLNTQSLEQQVTRDFPPCFLWHTEEDSTVPVENSLLMASALRAAKVPFECHVFPEGEHGLSLATPLVEREDGSGTEPSCEGWIGLAVAWIHRQCDSITKKERSV